MKGNLDKKGQNLSSRKDEFQLLKCLFFIYDYKKVPFDFCCVDLII